ncbi:COG4223 family protein [Vannielia litorea]|uniref:Mitochondrial inner membrane protein n=1 Tax=Vannielia litorea TaxID=1217970 RepID=A0A1N6HLL7_9RHOB|nr:hypothetical protein [Vannielia litorea]SIO20626.1 hypothetical protein SAMN05444002_3490 [Vannielia litorea]
MAGSDDKPEENVEKAGKEAPKTAGKASGRKTPPKQATTPEEDAPDSTSEERAPEAVEAKDAPSGDPAAPGAPLELSDPMKLGPSGKGEDAGEPAPEIGSDESTAQKPADVPDLTTSPEPEATPDAPAAAAPAPQKSGVVPMVFGGVLAGLIGFAAAWYIWGQGDSSAALEGRLTEQEEATAALRGELGGKASAETLAALEARVASIEAAPAADTSESEARVAAQAEALAALSARIEALEKAPVEGSQDPAAQAALAAYGREVEALRKEMSEQMTRMNAVLEAAKETEAQAAARQEEAAAAAARAAEQQAMLEVSQALDNGTAYDAPLGRISSAEVPEGLAAHAAEGVLTLDALKASFPAAARNALKIAREETAGEDGGGFGSWITRQVGARSLEPKEGDDPDAVLSRAEAALNAGDLGATLQELAALPPGGQQAMDQWIAQATRRNDAVTGASALSDTLASN